VTEPADIDESDFAPAVRALIESGRDWSEPTSFQEYLKLAFPQRQPRTAQRLSVQTLTDLDPLLRSHGFMVFHLGSPTGLGGRRTTRFALIKAPSGVEEFFLVDAKVFACAEETFIPTASYHEMYPFQLLGSIVETGAVNLAIASRLLAEALRLDEPSPRLAPATGASTYTFKVMPHSLCDVMWDHVAGQVEVDAVVFARRGGRWTVFVIEGKHGELESLSKLKLAYATLAIATKRVPSDVQIVPVYMRSWEEEGRLLFGVAECEMVDPRSAQSPVASITVKSARLLSMPFQFGRQLERG